MTNCLVFICSGCEIGSRLDLDGLCDHALKQQSVSEVLRHEQLCSRAGLELISDKLALARNNNVLIAACSPRAKTAEFDFGESVQVERVNLREQVVYCQPENQEDTQMMAEDYLRMGLAKLKNSTIPKPFIAETINTDILVLGGGITGMTAALASADAGYSVHLIEKEDQLGGFANQLSKKLPDKAPWTREESASLEELRMEIEKHESIHIMLETSLISISGQPGEFIIKTSTAKETDRITAGAIVLATGWIPYDPTKLNDLKYGSSPDIISSVEIEQRFISGKFHRPSTQQAPRSVLFIQCAGSRDPDHLAYCSGVCCGTSLKQARMIREQHPDCKIFIIYKDIRTPGMLENYYHEIQKDPGIFLTKGIIHQVQVTDSGIEISVQDSLIHKHITITAEMVVLATGMVPANSNDLQLNYRQGPGLPTLKYDFPDSHFICFPYETRRTGIYAAGAVRAPMRMDEAKSDALGAVTKAIQVIKAVKKGQAVHPRSLDASYPSLYMQRCTDCKRCTEECPFGTYDETEKGTPLPNPNRCRRCGICMGSCPERIISFEDYSLNAVSEMIKSIEVPDEFEEKPRILAFVCENDAYPAFDMAGMKHLQYSAFLRIIPVRCIGSINKVWISDALSQGFDGIMQIGCKPGDDYQCHFIHGSELTEKRGENIQETLQTMMLEPERIRTEFVEISDYHRIPGMINDYIEEIELIGPNPFKE